MLRFAFYGSIVILAAHGLVHLMGFVAYWPLGTVAELPYKTTLVGGRWEVGAQGMRVYALLWLVTCLGFLAVAMGLIAGQSWWRPLLWGTLALSTLLILLDWSAAFRGGILNAVVLLVALVALQLSGDLHPTPFRAYPESTPALSTVPLPENLPTPVARFFRTAVGDEVPVITTSVVSGRGYVRLKGIRFPARYRFTLEAGEGYHHYIEATVFGIPLFKVNEWYLDGHSRLELPGQVVENDLKTDLAANLSLWGEALFQGPFLVIDPRVRWEPVDETHARLLVPTPEGDDSFSMTFDSKTGLIASMEAARWQEPSSPAKKLWRMEVRGWQRNSGMLVPSGWALKWEDDSEAWFVANVEEAIHNVDVTKYIRTRGL